MKQKNTLNNDTWHSVSSCVCTCVLVSEKNILQALEGTGKIQYYFYFLIASITNYYKLVASSNINYFFHSFEDQSSKSVLVG